MTGLIHRMAQRARGTLPGIEPLVRSHQTAAAALGLPLEQNLESAPVLQATAPPARLHSSPGSREEPPIVDRHDHSPDALPRRAAAQTEPETPAAVQLRSDAPAPASESRAQPGDSIANLPQPPAAQRPREPLILEAHAIKPNLQEAAAADRASLVHVDAPSRALEPSLQRRNDLPAARTEPVSVRQPQTPGPLESTTEHTEIHITIGSIEMRTPQTEAPRKPAAFKPRVTLDDYLRRRSGAGS